MCAFIDELENFGIPKMSQKIFLIHGVSFRIVYFETVAVTILLDILITKYDFYIAKNWSF